MQACAQYLVCFLVLYGELALVARLHPPDVQAPVCAPIRLTQKFEGSLVQFERGCVP